MQAGSDLSERLGSEPECLNLRAWTLRDAHRPTQGTSGPSPARLGIGGPQRTDLAIELPEKDAGVQRNLKEGEILKISRAA